MFAKYAIKNDPNGFKMQNLSKLYKKQLLPDFLQVLSEISNSCVQNYYISCKEIVTKATEERNHKNKMKNVTHLLLNYPVVCGTVAGGSAGTAAGIKGGILTGKYK